MPLLQLVGEHNLRPVLVLHGGVVEDAVVLVAVGAARQGMERVQQLEVVDDCGVSSCFPRCTCMAGLNVASSQVLSLSPSQTQRVLQPR